MSKKEKYESIEVVFTKNSEIEMELYKFLLEDSKLLGKSSYIKQLILKEMKSTK